MQFREKFANYFASGAAGPVAFSDIVSVLETDGLDVMQVLTEQQADSIRGKNPLLRYWRRASVDVYIAGIPALLSLLHSDRHGEDALIEIRFSSNVNLGVMGMDNKAGSFNPAAKNALVALILDLSVVFEADGFVYGFATDDELVGPPAMSDIRDHVETGDRWFNKKQVGLMAGLRVGLLHPDCFAFDEGDKPMYYTRRGFYLFDRMWPLPKM